MPIPYNPHSIRNRPVTLGVRVTEEEHKTIYDRIKKSGNNGINDTLVNFIMDDPHLTPTETEVVLRRSEAEAQLKKSLRSTRTILPNRPQPRTKTIVVRLTEEEHVELKDEARAHMLSPIAYARRQMIGTDIRAIAYDDTDWKSRAKLMTIMYP